jgi:probable rRNA maturation factor
MSVTIDVLVKDQIWLNRMPDIKSFICEICAYTLQTVFHAPQVKNCEVSVVLADDVYIQKLNAQYRHLDKPTNVLSFPSEELKAGEYKHLPEWLALGDIILSYTTIARESAEQAKDLRCHLAHMVVHGTLHLLGYDHEDSLEAEHMEQTEITILQYLKIKNPYEEGAA